MNILCIDQARHGGYSIWDYENKKLISYSSYDFGNKKYTFQQAVMLIERHTESLMRENDISAVFVEDINLRKNVKTFKNLAQLQGVLLNLFEKTGIAYDTILPSKWQGYCKARGRTLKEQKGEITSVRLQGKSPSKILSIEFVKDNFDIDTTNDNIADAICIGWYVVNNIRIESGKSDFKEIGK